MKVKFALMFIVMSLMLANLPPQTAAAAPATVTPPKNFFKFPFKTNRIWRMSGGPHPVNGTSGALSSIDFKPAWHSGCSVPSNGKDYVVAAAAGTVKYSSSQPNLIIIDHGNGWSTRYMHLTGILKKSGSVAKDEPLGYPSCLGGQATGAHVHFTIAYNGVPQSMAGVSFEGWTVQSTSIAYEGCLKHNVTQQKVCRQMYAITDDNPAKTFRSMRTVVYIKSMHSRKYLSVNLGANASYPANIVIQRAWAGASSQKWYLIPVDATYYELRPLSSSKCMDIQGAYTGNGGRVQEYSCNGTNAQRFQFLTASGTQLYIQAKHSGKMLDVTDWSTGNIHIQQWQKEAQANQYWIVSIIK